MGAAVDVVGAPPVLPPGLACRHDEYQVCCAVSSQRTLRCCCGWALVVQQRCTSFNCLPVWARSRV
jgi:hypothetical protein